MPRHHRRIRRVHLILKHHLNIRKRIRMRRPRAGVHRIYTRAEVIQIRRGVGVANIHARVAGRKHKAQPHRFRVVAHHLLIALAVRGVDFRAQHPPKLRRRIARIMQQAIFQPLRNRTAARFFQRLAQFRRDFQRVLQGFFRAPAALHRHIHNAFHVLRRTLMHPPQPLRKIEAV